MNPLFVGDRGDMIFLEDSATWAVAPTTSSLCLYDLHPFQGSGVGIPQSYNRTTRQYLCIGRFCSWGCAKSYLIERISQTQRNAKSFFTTFLRGFMNIRYEDIVCPPPLEQLMTLYVENVAKKVPNPEAAAVEAWRSVLNPYRNLRRVDNVFLRVSQVYEENNNLIKKNAQTKRHAELMTTQEPKPVLLTEQGRTQQMKLVRQRVAPVAAASSSASAATGSATPTLGPLDSMLGISLSKKKKI